MNQDLPQYIGSMANCNATRACSTNVDHVPFPLRAKPEIPISLLAASRPASRSLKQRPPLHFTWDSERLPILSSFVLLGRLRFSRRSVRSPFLVPSSHTRSNASRTLNKITLRLHPVLFNSVHSPHVDHRHVVRQSVVPTFWDNFLHGNMSPQIAFHFHTRWHLSYNQIRRGDAG